MVHLNNHKIEVHNDNSSGGIPDLQALHISLFLKHKGEKNMNIQSKHLIPPTKLKCSSVW